MTDVGDLVHHLRNTSVGDIVRALERDGFSLKRETATGGRIYAHSDGRITVIHITTGATRSPEKRFAAFYLL
jgi:predicted RNA binding protein YcfA (HicA-like mRNA interferase family)